MDNTDEIATPKNVSQFNDDACRHGQYTYRGAQNSAQLATERIGRAIADSYDFRGKSVLDLGCGDGVYSVEMLTRGAAWVHGIDAAPAAIEVARERAASAGLGTRTRFEVGNIYDLKPILGNQRFDLVMLWGVLHHLPSPSRALAGIRDFADTIIILEPNGMNPILKALEILSPYHVAHEERSFTPMELKLWMRTAGFQFRYGLLINLVPMFCPAWMARQLRAIEPIVERIPGLRDIACGQVLLIGSN